MGRIFNIFKYFQRQKTEFIPYNEKEDNYTRLASLYTVFSLVVVPIFIGFSYISDVPPVYTNVGLFSGVFLLVSVILCGVVVGLRDKLIYFFIFLIFLITFYIFYFGLLQSEFDSNHLVYFFSIYSLCTVVVQRFYPLVLYNIFVIGLCFYGVFTSGDSDPNYYIIGLVFLIALTTTIVIFSRQKLLNNVEDYTEYLRSILDDPSLGYMLLKVGKNIEIVDSNKELRNQLFSNKDETGIIKDLFSWFSKEELKRYKELKIGTRFFKKVEISTNNYRKVYELKISLLPLKNGDAHLIRFTDITFQEEKRRALEIEEKKYKNLYHRNSSGVFTCDNQSVIKDANSAFLNMFDSTIKIGSKLFEGKDFIEWELVRSSLNKKNSSNNIQIQYKLKTKEVKTLVFSWYYDKFSELYEGYVIDLTTFQRASQALRQSEEKYRLIFEESNDSILLLDGDKIVNSNRTTTKYFGEIIGKKLFDLSSDKSPNNQKKYTSYKSKLGTERLVQFNWVFQGINGEIEAEVSIVQISLDNHIYFQCVIHDRTEINKVLKELESNHQNLKNILDNGPEGILILKENIKLYTNPTLKDLLGEDWQLEKIFEGEEAELFLKGISKQREEGGRVDLQLNLQKEGATKVINLSIGTTTFQEEEAQFLYFKDITAQTELASEKIRMKLIEETNKTLETEISKRKEAQQELEDQYIRTKAILESSSNTFFLTLDSKGNVNTFNSQCEKFFNYSLRTELAIGMSFRDSLKNLVNPEIERLFGRIFNKILKNKSKQVEIELTHEDRNYWLEVYLSPILNSKGEVIEISLVAHDISERKKASMEIISSLKEKEILLKEIHHRVKNNLQVISSILNLQSSFITDANTLKILQESRNRIRSMAIIHESLYRKEDFSSINFCEYLQNLVHSLTSSYGFNQNIHVNFDLDVVKLNLDQAIPCGLIVNELVSNAIKYAWREGEDGEILIRLKEKGKTIYIEVGDDGIGLPEPFEKMNSDTLGLQLVITLIDQLDGEIRVDSDNGTNYLFNFEKITPNN